MTITINQKCRLQIQVITEVVIIEVIIEAATKITTKAAAEAATEATIEIATEVLIKVASGLKYHLQIQFIIPVIQARQGLKEISQHLN